ncbi:carbohydrate binding family 9 domain-containing protein [candidate division WOR-3 bacterium]|nr:carbohydrate binding family 9 domain-containing protein [candidate division WOR-3 bacterium]
MSLALVFFLFSGRTAEAVRILQPPRIDGVLDEACWHENPGFSDFMERYPDLGEEPSESTRVVICYDEKSLYAAFFCYDSDPSQVEIRLVPRESSGGDYVLIYFDTYDDDRNAYMLGINTMGIQRDVRITGWNYDYSWNGVWYSEAGLTPWGWCAEIEIPFKTLRFKPKDEQIWGLSAYRWIDHRDESVVWGNYEESDQGTRIDRFGELTGIQGVCHGLHLEFLPHLTQTAMLEEPELLDTIEFVPLTDGVVGMDVKWGINSNLTLDVTTFPDYGQIEADPEQINLSKYEPYLSERRPFFLEGRDLFSFSNFTPVYTRRIGRRLPDGTLAPIYTGAKFTGKVSGTQIGMIEVYTGQKPYDYYGLDTLTEPATLFSIARIKQDLLKRSNAGIIFTSRDRWNPDRSTDYRGDHVAGADLGLGIADDWNCNLEFLHSFHSDATKPGGPMGAFWISRSGTWNYSLSGSYTDSLADLSAVGWLNRPGHTGGTLRAGYDDSWGQGLLRSFSGSVYTQAGMYLDDSVPSYSAGTYFGGSFQNNWSANMGTGISRSFYQEDSVSRWVFDAYGSLSTDYGKKLAGGVWASVGDQYVYRDREARYFGHVITFGPYATWRPLDNLTVWADADFQRLFYNNWHPDTSVYPDWMWTASEGFLYTATRRLSFRLNAQQNTDAESYTQQLLATWEIAPLSFLYLASSVNLSGDTATDNPFDVEVSSVTLYGKIVYLFRI